MSPWLYFLAGLTSGWQVGDYFCERRWRKERGAEFERRMAAPRDQSKGGRDG